MRRFDPPLPSRLAWFAGLQFLLLLAGLATFAWHGGGLPRGPALAWLVALGAGLWAAWAALRRRLGLLEALALQAGALAMASSVQGLSALHQACKPLAMVLLIAAVLARPLMQRRVRWLLVAALACSLAGDVFLMLKGYFIPGLLSFLVAHLCYIALFRQGVPWFASRAGLLAPLALGAAMYGWLFPGLDPVLKIAVAAYTVVIALMAAQAIGRATLLRDRAATGVALGALFFMASDSLLAINRFATPLPLAQLWVLGTYYVAQWLIAHHSQAPATAAASPRQPVRRPAATA